MATAVDHAAQTRTATGSGVLPVTALAIYFVTGIFYLFPSGNPQPADVLLLASVIVTLACIWRQLPDQPVLYLSVALFVGWIVAVNVVWYFIVPDFAFLKKTSFYLYNAIVFLYVVAIGFHDFARLKKWMPWACLIALIAQILYIELLAPGTTSRATGTFNNPNQLGYWALLMLACFAVLRERTPLGGLDMLTLAAGFYVVSLSLSKAASISAMVLLILVFVFCGFRRAAAYVLVGALAIGLTLEIARGGVVERFMEVDALSALQRRLASIGEQEDDSLMHRGYIRLFENPQYLAFGAGEGSVERLTGEGAKANELHSTLGNILMSYGLVGIGLFVLLLFVIFARAPLASTAYFGPVMLYGITHMGLRFSLFWVFLGLVCAQAFYGVQPQRWTLFGPARPSDWPQPNELPVGPSD